MNGGAAFPSPGVILDGHQQGAYEGMTLRDYFAAKAMAAILSNDAAMLRVGQAALTSNFQADAGIAGAAYAFADTMIAERAK